MKTKVKILDYLFSHSIYSNDFQESKYIIWDRNPINKNDKIVFYTDQTLDLVKDNQITYGWLLESPEITPMSYEWIKKNNSKFTYVLTHNKELLDKHENFLFSPAGGCWIKPYDQKIYNKSKLLSIIASSKRMTQGHLLRHLLIQDFRNRMDVYGRGYNFIPYKLEGLKDYAFSFSIENTKKDFYFTEKIIDCFVTGTVPIYYGCPSISKFFNIDGIIIIDNVKNINDIIDNLTFEKYEQMKYAILDNFERAKEYIITEDFIYKNYLKNTLNNI